MGDAVTYKTILVEEDGGVATVTLNRPDRMNAWTNRMGAELNHAIHALDGREEIRAIVVTGAGKAFCAGADLSRGEGSFGGDNRDAAAAQQAREEARRALEVDDDRDYWELNTPIIAAMNGAAVGVGMTMPMQWDIRIANEDAKYGFVFNRRGVIPELNSPWLVPRVVGLSRGLELLISGRIFTGREGAEMGLFSKAVPGEEVLAEAHTLARDIATNVAPVSAAIVKRLVYEDLCEPDRGVSLRRNHRLFGWAASKPDAKEGPVAFLQKRDPDWNLSKNADFPEDAFKK